MIDHQKMINFFEAITFFDDSPQGVVNDVNYGGSVKSFAFLLNSYCNVSIEKVQESLFELTDGQLQISKGMINGLWKEFSGKTEADHDIQEL